MAVVAPLGASPPAHTAHGGFTDLTFVTTVSIFLIAIGLAAFGTYPTASIVRSFTAGPLVTVTLNCPSPRSISWEPSYGAGTGAGNGSVSAPFAAGSASPFVSAHNVRSMPDSAMARACALAMWLAAMTGSVEVNARNATVSAVSIPIRISVIGKAIPASDLIRRLRRTRSRRDRAMSSYAQAHRLTCPLVRKPSGGEVAKIVPSVQGRISGYEHIVLRYKWRDAHRRPNISDPPIAVKLASRAACIVTVVCAVEERNREAPRLRRGASNAGGLGAISGPGRSARETEKRRGFAGALRTPGVLGPFRGPDGVRAKQRSAAASPGRFERWAVWGPFRGPDGVRAKQRSAAASPG